jgi:hypothetical protein
MKRGLITWNPAEIPREEFASRQAAARDLLSSLQLAALVVYSDLWRSNHARYFTNFMPYFNRALLILPLDGAPLLLCGLSPRVYPWIRSVTTIDDIRPAGNFVTPLTQVAFERGWKRLGILDAGELPADLAARFTESKLELVPVPGGDLFRPEVNKVEIALRRFAANRCRAILLEELVAAAGLTDHGLAGVLERRFRAEGAEDVILLMTDGTHSPAPARGETLPEGSSVSVALEYRGHWVRVTRPNCSEDLMGLCYAAWKNGYTFVEDLSGAYPYSAGVRGSVFSAQTEIQVAGKRLYYGDTCRIAGNGSMEPL